MVKKKNLKLKAKNHEKYKTSNNLKVPRLVKETRAIVKDQIKKVYDKAIKLIQNKLLKINPNFGL